MKCVTVSLTGGDAEAQGLRNLLKEAQQKLAELELGLKCL